MHQGHAWPTFATTMESAALPDNCDKPWCAAADALPVLLASVDASEDAGCVMHVQSGQLPASLPGMGQWMIIEQLLGH